MNKDRTVHLLLRVRGLAVLRGVLASSAAQDFVSLLGLLAAERPEPTAVAETFGRLWEELAVEAGDLLPDAWQSYLAGRLLDEENPFSLGDSAWPRRDGRARAGGDVDTLARPGGGRRQVASRRVSPGYGPPARGGGGLGRPRRYPC